LLWPERKLAVVSDLHLEKASHFALQGQFLPPHETFTTLETLKSLLEFCAADTVIFLGDSFHDSGGYNRMDKEARNIFDTLCRTYKIIWVIGNHDAGFVPPCAHIVEEYQEGPLTFRHQAEPGTAGEVSGHYHPKARMVLKRQKISYPCFLMDEKKIIMPAFGTMTGGLDIRHKELRDLLIEPFETHLLGREKIYTVPSDRIL
jgi:DNA ligase-associated metallophosphoesterase